MNIPLLGPGNARPRRHIKTLQNCAKTACSFPKTRSEFTPLGTFGRLMFFSLRHLCVFLLNMQLLLLFPLFFFHFFLASATFVHFPEIEFSLFIFLCFCHCVRRRCVVSEVKAQKMVLLVFDPNVRLIGKVYFQRISGMFGISGSRQE